MIRKIQQYIVIDYRADNYANFNKYIEEAIALIRKRHKKIILNFTEEIELDSKKLKMLHALLKTAHLKLIDVKIIAPNEKMRDILVLTRLGVFSKIYTSLEDAIEQGEFLSFFKYAGITTAVIFSLLYAHTIKWLFFSWRLDPYYSHGPIVILASAFLAWKKRSNIKKLKYCFSPKSAFFIALSILAYLMGYFLETNFLEGVSMIFFLLGFTLLIMGPHIYKQLFAPIALLFFAIPIPRIEEAASFLQHFTAKWATFLTSKLGVATHNSGINIFFKDSCVSIDAPCSGLRSLIALLFIGTLLINMINSGPYKKAAMFLTILPISIFSNLFRIVVLILIANSFGLKTAELYFHYISGLLFFGLALSALIMEKRALKCKWGIS